MGARRRIHALRAVRCYPPSILRLACEFPAVWITLGTNSFFFQVLCFADCPKCFHDGRANRSLSHQLAVLLCGAAARATVSGRPPAPTRYNPDARLQGEPRGRSVRFILSVPAFH